MTKEMQRRRALLHECPKCSANVGEPCRDMRFKGDAGDFPLSLPYGPHPSRVALVSPNAQRLWGREQLADRTDVGR